jgi:pimeloyl-ACP methyl ester carboxylesterase
LSQHYNLLLVDLPGHGKTAGNRVIDSNYSFDLIGQRIWDVVDHLRLETVHLVGVSLGTIIALTMQEQRPDAIRSLVNAGAIVRLNRKLRVLASSSLALAKVIGYPAFYRLSARIMMPRKNHQRSREVFIRESKALSTEEFKKWTNMYYGLNKTLRELFLAPERVPHLIVMGEQDHLFRDEAKRYAQERQRVRFEVVPKCGHVVSIERAEQFNRLCLEHLAQHAASKTL